MSGVIAERVVYPDPYPHGTKCTAEEGMTRQSELQASDINLTIKKYNLQPLELQVGWSGKLGEYADVSALTSYQAALNQIRKAEEQFMELPPEVREKFDNSHVRMLDAWQNGEMLDVFEEIGFLEKLPAKTEVEMVQARNDETGRYESGKEPAK